MKTGWNHLNRPDQYVDKKTGKKGPLQFTTQLIASPEDLDEIKDDIDSVVDDFYEETIAGIKSAKKRKAIQKKYPYEEHEDDEGEPTGDFILRAKSKPNKRGKARFGIFDAAGNRTKALVFGGSTIRVQLYVKGYYNPSSDTVGATLYIQAVQIIELAGDEGGNGENPFGEVEGGWTDDGSYDDGDDGDADGEADDEDEDDNDDF